MSDSRIALVFTVLALGVLGAIAFLLRSGPPAPATLQFETVKLLVQFFLVGVLGVIVSLLVQNYNQHRDKEILINDVRKTVLGNLIKAYSDTKRARRVIMAHRLAGGMLPYTEYDKQMRCIIDTQLALETLSHEIRTSQKYFGKDCVQILARVLKMEKFLGEIIDEYKDSLQDLSKCPDTISLTALPKLRSTMGKDNELNVFRPNFVIPYRSAVARIRRQIFH